MRLWSRIRSWLRASFSRSRAECEMDAELRFHVEAYMEDLVRKGVPQGEAARRARLEFGGMDRTKEECREARGANLVEDLFQDLRYGARALRKSPAFTSIAVLTLALGIGANTAIFTLLDAVFFRSLPVRDPQELVLLQWHAHKSPKYDEYSSFGYCAEGGGKEDPWGCSFSSPMYDSIRAQASVFEGTVAFGGPAQLNLSGNGPASMVSGNIVSGDFFQTLGIHAARGRLLEPSDDMATAPPVVALGYGYWQSAFGGSDSAIGQNINLNGVSFTIVGVAEAKFPSLAAGKKDEMWIPRSAFPDVGPHLGWSRLKDAGNSWMVIVGRLKPGVSVAQAQEAVSIIFRNELSYGSDPLLDAKYEPSILLLPAQNGLIRGTGVQQPLCILMAAVGILLLIACANVAGLLLARSGSRSKEMAVRLALGASRARLARQLLTESLLLSFFGGVVGILVAYWGVHATTVLLSGGVSGSFPFPVAPNLRILAFTVAVSILSGVFFGLAPAMRSTRLDLTPALKEGAGYLRFAGHVGRRWFNLGDALVVAQIALAVVVIVGAGLLVRTLNTLENLNPGFDTKNVLIFTLDPALLNYKEAQIQNLYRELQSQFAALPGVVSVSYSTDALLDGGMSAETVSIEGRPDQGSVNVDSLATGPGFFETMRIPLLTGRVFRASDFIATSESPETSADAAHTTSTPPTPIVLPVVVNEEFVRQYSEKQNPLGMRLVKGNQDGSHGDITHGKVSSRTWEVVGVVANAKYARLREEIHPTVYMPLNGGGAHFELRTAGDPSGMIPAIRSIVARADGNLPVSGVNTTSQNIYDQLSDERFVAQLSSFFGLLALVLACIGVYGLLSYEVARRTREIGIRVALGAERRSLLRLVVGRGIRVAVLGGAVGALAAAVATRYLQSILFGVRPGDPLTLLCASGLLLLVTLAASYVPARRAMRVDPMVALRYE